MQKQHQKPLKHFADFGIKLIPTYENGATKGSWQASWNFISDVDLIKIYWKQGFRRFQFIPYDNGLICFDIDRKNGKDGLKELYQLFNFKGLVMPEYMINIENFPAYIKTPSNGLHLYFKLTGKDKYKSESIAPGFEVVHYNHLLTAPGSYKNNKQYQFYGNLEQAPELPYFIKQSLTPIVKFSERPKAEWTFNQKEYGNISLDRIVETIDKQGQYSPSISRNQYSYAISLFAKKKGYDAESVESFLINKLAEPNFKEKEIRATVKSAYKR